MELNIDEKAQQLTVAAKKLYDGLPAVVRSPREYEGVSQYVKDVKAHFKTLEGHRTYLKEPFLEGGRRVDEFFRAALKFCSDAEAAAKRLLLTYESDQRRIAAEKQRQLDEEARKQREALEAKARLERERVDREASDLRKKADEARKAGQTTEANKLLIKAATKVEKSEEKAETFISQANAVVAPKVVAEIPVIQGQSTKTVWRGRVKDKALVPEEYKVVDDSLIQKFAKATQGKISVPGIEFYSENIKSSHAA